MTLTLVGNKVDLERERAVSREEAFLYSSSINGSYFETSAINGGQGIEQVFISTARGLLRLAESTDCSSIKRYESTDSILSYNDINGKNTFILSIGSITVFCTIICISKIFLSIRQVSMTKQI